MATFTLDQKVKPKQKGRRMTKRHNVDKLISNKDMSTTFEVTLGGRFSLLLESEITNVKEYYMAFKTIISDTSKEVVGVRAIKKTCYRTLCQDRRSM